MSQSEVEIKGFSELLNKLKDLPDKVEKKVLRTAVFRGAQKLRDRVKENAPARSGNLRKQIKAIRRRGQRGEVSAGVVGPFYARMVEFGHVVRNRRKGPVLGHVPANAFIGRAYEANKEAILEAIAEAVGELLDAELKKEGFK